MNVRNVSFNALTVKGMTFMSKPTSPDNFVYDLVNHYAELDSDTNEYELSINDLNDFDRHKFASLMIAFDEAYGSEATSSDNPAYEKSMLPALLKYMSNTTSFSNEYDFARAWEKGVSSYFDKILQDKLDRACQEKDMLEKWERRA